MSWHFPAWLTTMNTYCNERQRLVSEGTNLLKTQILITGGGGGGRGVMGTNFQLLMPSPNIIKSQSLIAGVWEENKLLMPSPNLLKSPIPITPIVGRGGGCWHQFWCMPSPNLLKSQSPIKSGGGGELVMTNFPPSLSECITDNLGN